MRETLNNIQKHSGATRVALSAARRGPEIWRSRWKITARAFPSAEGLRLDELELLRLGPVSIKRRVRMLGGELVLESKPGQGAKIEIRVPV